MKNPTLSLLRNSLVLAHRNWFLVASRVYWDERDLSDAQINKIMLDVEHYAKACEHADHQYGKEKLNAASQR
jgi:hypothetical protein